MEWFLAIVGVANLVALVVYTVFTGYLLREATRANRASDKAVNVALGIASTAVSNGKEASAAQLKAMQGLVTEAQRGNNTSAGMLKVAQSAIAVAGRSVRASETSAETASRALAFTQNLEEPNVKLVTADPFPVPLTTGPKSITITFKNVGRSTAFHFTVHALIMKSVQPVAEGWRQIRREPMNIALQPGDTKSAVATIEVLSAEDVEWFYGRVKDVHPLGLRLEATADYDDAFGNSYTVTFCMEPSGEIWVGCVPFGGHPAPPPFGPADFEVKREKYQKKRGE